MTTARIPSMDSALTALTRHNELHLTDNSLDLQLDGEYRTYNTKRGPAQSDSVIGYRYTVTLTLHPGQMQTLINILNAAPLNGVPTND